MNIYLDLFSGISGDMLCGTLINLGVPFDYVEKELAKLGLDGYNLFYDIKNINGISCGNFDVVCHHTDHSGHSHNSLSHILSLIEKSTIDEKAKIMASKVFRTLGEAEAKVHNTDIENLNFHEVGAVDSIVDIVAGSVCLAYLDAENIYFGDLPSFWGEIKCSHGIIPLPGPAVCELTKGMKWNNLNEKGELITPTGAAFLKALGCQRNFGGFAYTETGCGCGNRETERGNYMRAFLFEEKEGNKDTVTEIEFNIDDMSPELCEPLMENLFSAGALDVMFFSGMMKKHRLGILVKVLCRKCDFEKIAKTVFLNSSTIGIRYGEKDRVCLERHTVTKNTVFGEINYKETVYNGVVINSKPEYEDVKKKAAEFGKTPKEILSEI